MFLDVLFIVVGLAGAGLFRLSSSSAEGSRKQHTQQGAGVALLVVAALGLSGALVHTPGLAAIFAGGLALMGIAILLIRPNKKLAWLVMPLFIVGALAMLVSLLFIQSEHSKRKRQRVVQTISE